MFTNPRPLLAVGPLDFGAAVGRDDPAGLLGLDPNAGFAAAVTDGAGDAVGLGDSAGFGGTSAAMVPVVLPVGGIDSEPANSSLSEPGVAPCPGTLASRRSELSRGKHLVHTR